MAGCADPGNDGGPVLDARCVRVEHGGEVIPQVDFGDRRDGVPTQDRLIQARSRQTGVEDVNDQPPVGARVRAGEHQASRAASKRSWAA